MEVSEILSRKQHSGLLERIVTPPAHQMLPVTGYPGNSMMNAGWAIQALYAHDEALRAENERLKEFLRNLAAAEEPEDYGNTGNRDDDYVLGCDRAEWHIGQKALAVLDQDGAA